MRFEMAVGVDREWEFWIFYKNTKSKNGFGFETVKSTVSSKRISL